MRRTYGYQRKRLLPLRDAVILHLEPYSSRANPYDMPDSTCQEAMAEILSASRGNLSRVMNELIDEGYLDEMRAHVPTGKLRRKTYVLTEVGMKEARSLRKETGERKIKLKDEEGGMFEVKLGDVPVELRDGSSLLDIALSVHKGVFDKAGYYASLRKLSDYVVLDDGMPRIEYFFGREDELDQIHDWFESDTKRFLEIKGLAGIGKTALAAIAFNDLRDRTNAIWLSLGEKKEPESVLEDLAAFLRLLGRKELDNYIKTHEESSEELMLRTSEKEGLTKSELQRRMEDVVYIVSNELEDLNALIVLDGCEKMKQDLEDVVRRLVHAVQLNQGIKVMLTGREIPSLYDKDLEEETPRRIALEALDRDSSFRILQEKGVESWRLEDAYAQTKGLPFLLGLIGPDQEFRTDDMSRYLEEEILSQLSPSEMRLLRIVTTFSGPVHSDAFFLWRGTKYSTIRSLVEKSLLVEVSPMVFDTHDIFRDFIRKDLKGRTRSSYHAKAAEFYQEQGDAESIINSAHHLMEAGERDNAAYLLASEGRRIIAKGYSQRLYQLLIDLDSKMQYSDIPEIGLLKGECLSIRGSWKEALDDYDHAYTLFEKEKDLLGLSACLRRMARIHDRMRNEEDALGFLEKSASISEKLKDLPGLADCYYNMAVMILRGNDPLASEEYVEKCIETAELSGRVAEKAKAYTALAILKEKREKYEESLQIKRKAARFADDSGDLRLRQICYNNLAVAYYNLDREKEALKHQGKALEFARRMGDSSLIALSLLNLAGVCIQKPDFNSAEEHLDEAIGIFNILGQEREIAYADLSYGFIYGYRGRWDKARRFIGESVNLMKKAGSTTDLFEVYSNAGQLIARKSLKEGMAYLNRASALAEGLEKGELKDELQSRIQSEIAGLKSKRRSSLGR